MREAAPVRDAVPRDAPCKREVGFSLPGRINASKVLFGSLAVGRGARVLLFLDDMPSYPAWLFGALRAGLVPLHELPKAGTGKIGRQAPRRFRGGTGSARPQPCRSFCRSSHAFRATALLRCSSRAA